MEEEVEHEEVEEEEEVEEIEEEVEEEVEEEAADEADSKGGSDGVEEIDEERKHAELLALPPHGTEVYLGGIPPDASEEDLKEFCESIGAATEVADLVLQMPCLCFFCLDGLNLLYANSR